jgi:hypothetical protein
MILAEGLNENTDKAAQIRFMKEIENIVNSHDVLGSVKRKAHWEFPCELLKKGERSHARARMSARGSLG